MCEHDELDYEPDEYRERLERAIEQGMKGASHDLEEWEIEQEVANWKDQT